MDVDGIIKGIIEEVLDRPLAGESMASDIATRAACLGFVAGCKACAEESEKYCKCAILSGVVFHDLAERRQCAAASRTANNIAAACRTLADAIESGE